MRPHEDGAAPARTGTTPVLVPSADSHEGSRLFYCKPPAPQSRHSRRWRGRPRFGAWDLLVWTIWIALTALVLLSLCAVLILAWPS